MTSGHYRRVAIRWMVLFAVGAILASCVPADQDLIPGLWELSETPAAGSSQADAKNISASNAGAGGEDAEIHGAVWNDLNADGIRDVAEPGLVGWTVFLDDDNDGTFDAGETSVVTDANGDYALTGLRHGTCVVVEVVQAGWQQTFPGAPGTHTVDLSPHQIVTGIDFGNKALPGEIHGLKFSDLDGDGVQDAGEPGLEGWTIFLDTDNDGVLDAGEESTVTDVDGTYSFVDLAVGNYTVAEVAASGWIQTFPTGNGRHDVTIGPGQVVSGIDFGNQQLGQIHGTKWNDLNGDGIRDADEPGLPGWTIFLDGDNDGVLDAGEASTTTDGDGVYSFVDLAVGNYTVAEVATSGWIQVFPTGNGRHDVTVGPGQVVSGLDFGNQQLGQIHGTKWNDLNADGVRDSGEAGLAGWTIFLDADNDGIPDAGEPFIVTDSSGCYSFIDLVPGQYTVAEVMQSGWEQISPGGSGTHSVTVAPGQTTTGIDFGNRLLRGGIHGTKFNDLDGNGVRDEGEGSLEPGLSGWTIFLDADHDGVLDAGEQSIVTDTDGAYAFTDLAPGDYTVVEVMQDNWQQTFPGGVGTHTLTVSPGQTISGITFGNMVSPGEIRGMKFNDLDGDGVRDDGEPGLEGWTIWVDLDGDGWYYPDGEPSAVTDSNGQYVITGVAPGTYTVTEVGQIGWCATFPAGGTHSVTIGPGEVVENIHFGNQLWFAYIGTPLPGPDYGGSLNWGDYDSDGDLDLVITGLPYGDSSADVFRNDGDDVFTPIQTGLWGDAMSAWGDCDNDGDLDLAIGDPDGNQVYRNDGSGVFSNIGAPWLPWALWIAWGDYDNDGDLDFGVGSTRWGNRIYRNDGNDLFTDSGINLPDSYGSGFSWGDYDNDGDLDLAIYGVWIDPPGACVTKVYRNEGGGVFAETGIALSDSYPYCPPPQWGDYDNDGDLDLADVSYAGGEQGLVTKIYRNDGSDTFTDIGVELPGGRCLWGDCDGDGDLDLVIAGIEGISANYSEISVCRNDGGDVFTDMDLYIWSFPEGYEIALGDYDNDGRLDLAAFVIWDGVVTKVLRNVIAVPNSIPSAPGGLSATVDGTSVTFSWSAASDVETPAPGLSYNLRVGTSSGGCDIFSPMADATSGYRRLPAIGNAQKRLSWTLKGLAPGRYYWSVQAIDTSYAGSAWAPEQTVFVGSALIIASAPGDQESLWRSQNNIIRLMFDGGITVPTPGDVLIQEMLDGGAYGPDLSSNFSYTLEHAGGALPMILKIQEDGSVLTHRKWYAVRNVGGWAGVADFMVQYVVQVGDANNDGRVLNTDVGAINEMIPTFDAVDDDRRDINGDGRVLNTDVGAANGNIPSFPVPKPDGH